MKKSSHHRTNRKALNCLIKSEVREVIAQMAEDDRRSVSSMTEILIEEAIEQRQKDTGQNA